MGSLFPITFPYMTSTLVRESLPKRYNESGSEQTMAESLISLEIESLTEGGYLATSRDLPGLVAQGRTIAECIEIAQDVARKLVESYLDRGDPLPRKLKSKNRIKFGIEIPVGIP
jgi:predicted RNase H-like HicB family nuclease